jgi:hypothetical protein
LLFLSSKITASVPAPTAKAVQLVLPPRIPWDDGPQVSQRPVALDREAEELGQLADQYGQGDSVHVTVADRLGKKLGYETQPRYACQNAQDPRDDRHHAGQGNSAKRIAARQRKDDAEYDSS